MAQGHRERAVRSDSLRNRDAILDAAAECLSANPIQRRVPGRESAIH